MNSKSVFVKVIAIVMVTITLGTTTIIFPSYALGPKPLDFMEKAPAVISVKPKVLTDKLL